jgi:hypothetical protein
MGLKVDDNGGKMIEIYGEFGMAKILIGQSGKLRGKTNADNWRERWSNWAKGRKIRRQRGLVCE